MAIGAAIASAVISSSEKYSQGKLANIQNRYSAKTNEMNAKLAEQQAQSALRKGEKEQQQIMVKGQKLKGEQKVAYGANGIDLSSRSAQNVMNETDYFTEADRLTAAANAIGEAWNSRLQAAQYQGKALIDRSNIKNAWKPALMAGLQAGLSTYSAMGGFSGGGQTTTWTQESGYVTKGNEVGQASFQLNRVGTGNVNMLAGSSPSSMIGSVPQNTFAGYSGYMADMARRYY